MDDETYRAAVDTIAGLLHDMTPLQRASTVGGILRVEGAPERVIVSAMRTICPPGSEAVAPRGRLC